MNKAQHSESLIIWNRFNSILMLCSSIMLIIFDSIFLVLFFACFQMLWLVWIYRGELKKLTPFGGYGNYVTGLRFLSLLLVGFYHDKLYGLSIPLILLGTIFLDGLDGYVARKYKSVTSFGKTFDIETDAFFTILLTSVLYLESFLPWWILIPGCLRYIYLLFKIISGNESVFEPPATHARVIAIIVYIALFTPFILPLNVYILITASASVLLIASFFWSGFILLKND